MANPVAYSNTGPLITELCSEEDLRSNFEQLQNVLNIIGNPYVPPNLDGDIPLAEPNAVAIRFRLTSVFSGSPSVANAITTLPNGTDGTPVVVRDMLNGHFSTAAGNEWGFAVPIRIGEVDVYEVRFLGFTGGGGGGDDELVARFATDTPGYLNAKFVATVYDAATYNSAIHQPVYAAIVGNSVRLYTPDATANATYGLFSGLLFSGISAATIHPITGTVTPATASVRLHSSSNVLSGSSTSVKWHGDAVSAPASGYAYHFIGGFRHGVATIITIRCEAVPCTGA